METVIEDNLRRAGYGIFRPEMHSLAEQIAVYRRAGTLLFAEGSAVHLAAPFLTPRQRAGILWRGWRRRPHILNQIAEGIGGAPFEFIGFAGVVYSESAAGVNERKLQPLHDFARLGNRLAAAGLIDRIDWRVPKAAETRVGVEATLAALREAEPEMHHAYWEGATRPVVTASAAQREPGADHIALPGCALRLDEL
jgi:hypothetical protein